MHLSTNLATSIQTPGPGQEKQRLTTSQSIQYALQRGLWSMVVRFIIFMVFGGHGEGGIRGVT